MKRLLTLKAIAVLIVGLGFPALAQQPAQDALDIVPTMQVTPGAKLKVKGTILKHDADQMLVRDQMGSVLAVRLAANTDIEEKKSNPFRGSKKYSRAQLVRGLNVEVEGRGDSGGALLADEVKFTDDDLRVALTVNSTVVPIENRLGHTENRLARTEQNAERLSGQLDELSEVANLAHGGARAAQEAADAALDGVNRTNERISSLDDYEVRKSTTVYFRVGSSVLSPDAKAMLDEIASQANSSRGFLIEVRGFASSDGSESLNRRLSENRARAVVRYLAEEHDISMRRIVLPYGYGSAMPVADNTTRQGRIQNRRAEVRVLVSRGLVTPVDATTGDVSSSRQP